MLTFLKRQLRESEDRLRYASQPREWLSQCQRWRDRWHKSDHPHELCQSIQTLCAAARWTQSESNMRSVQQLIRERVAHPSFRQIDWSDYVPDYATGHLVRAVILKPYLGPRERGVIYVAFEIEWGKLLGRSDMRDFAARYDLVLAPSGDPHNLINYAFAESWPHPLFTQISNAGDIDVLKGISDKLVILPLYASSWVNPTFFTPKPKSERAFDLIMVANFAKFKRHYLLFRALRSMSRDLRILLIGQDQDGRTHEAVEHEARWYGVLDRFTLRVNQSYPQVSQAFCDSRSSVILSRREGSCVVVAESMFSDTPVAVMLNAELGSRAFINEQTGIFLHDRALAEQLAQFVHEADRFTPRRWAEEHISCFASSQRLNDIVQQHALAQGQTWTRDLAPMHWCPNAALIRPEDQTRMQAERDDILQRFGLTIGRDLA